jgi:lactoylglutathione lyase
MTTPNARDVVTELLNRLDGGDISAIDDLMAVDMINHAGGPHGRDGWKQIGSIITLDLGHWSMTHHHLVGDGDLVAHHVTIHGTHQASTMPLLRGRPVTGNPVSWEYMHLWRLTDGQIVEHWACRDDVGLLAQLDAWPR